MITNIRFPPATLSRLQAEAKKNGKDLDTIVTEAIEAKMAILAVFVSRRAGGNLGGDG